ncbi:MAG: pyridoxal phosphate-dependent aminotransferase [Bdellovibrionales bacterium]|nr:pyridoxal phosphate-dependent aminotransferase [Bdellovibrionales bacterium]
MILSKKIQVLKPSAVQALSARAKEQTAQGKDVVNLALGEPTWECFEPIKDTAMQSIQKGCSHYAPAVGRKDLRQAIAKNINQHLNLNYDFKNVTVSIGAKFCLFSALQTLADPTDEVLIPAPYWVSYPSMVDLIGAQNVIVETDTTTHKLTADILKKYITDKSKILILNSPNNPTGAVHSIEELKSIGEVIKTHPRLCVLSDDIYNRMVIDNPPDSFAPHLLQACPELKDRVICINAASKNYAMPGWRLGWAVAPVPVVQAMSSLQSQTVSSAPTISQMAMVPTFDNTEEDVQKTHQLIKEKKQTMCQALSSIQEINFQEPQGAFYLWPNVESLFGRKFKNHPIQSSMDVCTLLSQHFSLFAVPGEEFGRAGYIRLYFAVPDRDIEKCADRIKDFISQTK